MTMNTLNEEPHFCAHLWSNQGVDGRGWVVWPHRAAQFKGWQNGKQIGYLIWKIWLYPLDILIYSHKITGISIKIATFLKFVVSVKDKHYYRPRGLKNCYQIKSIL